jgi:antitoxin component YwqK of YwqJK toxin-antitoxin module
LQQCYCSNFELMWMKSKLFSFFLIAILSANHLAYAQSDSLNFSDTQGWKQGKWIESSDGDDVQGCAAGTKLEEGFYKDNRKVGLWRIFWCNGKLKNELVYNADRSISSKDYYPDGKLKEEGTWNSIGWVGPYKTYHPNGKLYYEHEYDKEGKRTGKQRYYYDNGNLMFDGEWSGGKEAGVIKEYYENGALRSEKTFNEGKLDTNNVKIYAPKEVKAPVEKIEPKKEEVKPPVNTEIGAIKDGFNKTFNREGKIDREGEFKNAKFINGKQYFYKDGKIEKIAIFREGKVIRYETVKE